MNKIQEIVKSYRAQLGNGKPMPLRQFARELSKPLAPLQKTITYSAVNYWENGKREPSGETLHALMLYAQPNSWVWHFANDLKAAKWPGVFPPTGEIGKRILAPEQN